MYTELIVRVALATSLSFNLIMLIVIALSISWNKELEKVFKEESIKLLEKIELLEEQCRLRTRYSDLLSARLYIAGLPLPDPSKVKQTLTCDEENPAKAAGPQTLQERNDA